MRAEQERRAKLMDTKKKLESAQPMGPKRQTPREKRQQAKDEYSAFKLTKGEVPSLAKTKKGREEDLTRSIRQVLRQSKYTKGSDKLYNYPEGKSSKVGDSKLTSLVMSNANASEIRKELAELYPGITNKQRESMLQKFLDMRK